jgi:hypothetical protein
MPLELTMRTLSLVCLVSLAAPLAAQYHADFESFTASASGTIITGQDGFYIPAAGGYDGMVYTYAGNTIGIPTNPNGGSQFYSGLSAAISPYYVRAQRNITFPPRYVHIESDILVNYIGTGTPAQYPCSLSLQDSSTALSSNIICAWQSTTPPYTWQLYVTSGTTTAALGIAGFQNLDANVWHHWGVTIDLTSEVYVDFTLTNGATNVTSYYAPNPPMPLGNAGRSYPLPTGFRLFTGGSTGNNRSAVDNLIIDLGAIYTTYGAGCAGSLGAPTLAAVPGLRPTIGTTFQVDLTNLPLGLGVITMGFSDTLALGSVPLPADLTTYGFTGCFLYADPVVSQFLVGTGTAATWSITIPAVPAIVGLPIFQQGVSIDNVAPGIAFSNGGKLIVGY